MLLSHEALLEDAYTKYTLYTTHECMHVLVSQFAAIIQIFYLKNGRSSLCPCSLPLLRCSSPTEMLVNKLNKL